MANRKPKNAFRRIVLILISLILLGTGINSTFSLWPFYRNYWGGIIYGPIAIAVGFLVLYIGIFRASKLNEKLVDKRGRAFK